MAGRRRWGRRGTIYLILAAATLAACLLASSLPLLRGPLPQRLSTALGWVSLLALAAALAVGPWHVLDGRRPPVSLDLRRDLGVWAGLTGLAHTVLGLQVHMRGEIARYFLHAGETPALARVRFDLFGLANHTGAVAALGLLVLLAVSSDASLRRLGQPRWKGVQRLTYPVAILTVLHGAAYQWLERRRLVLVLAFALVVALVTVLQGAGARRWRARRDPRGARGERSP